VLCHCPSHLWYAISTQFFVSKQSARTAFAMFVQLCILGNAYIAMLPEDCCLILCRYGMLDPNNLDLENLPLTIRAVFIIGPDKKLKLSLNYPASVGRNMDEIVRCVDALQLSAKHSVVSSCMDASLSLLLLKLWVNCFLSVTN